MMYIYIEHGKYVGSGPKLRVHCNAMVEIQQTYRGEIITLLMYGAIRRKANCFNTPDQLSSFVPIKYDLSIYDTKHN